MAATVASSGRPTKQQPKSSKVVRIVFIALLCDLLAFTMPLPLFPRLIDNFVLQESRLASSAPTLLSHTLSFVRQLRTTLFSFSSLPTPSPSTMARWDLTLLGGLLSSLFSFCQFFVSPHLGAISDRYGRRPVLLASMAGNLISAALWLFASSFGIYAASRVVGGLSEGNVQLSIAVISDVSTKKNRGRALALVGVAFSLAFTLGPSLGAYFASRTLGSGERIVVAGREIKLNGYAVPAVGTLVLLTIETLYLALFLPETRWWDKGEQDEEDKNEVEVAGPKRTLEQRLARLRQLEWLHFGFLFFFSGAEFTLTFLTYTLFDYTNAQNGMLLGFIGILSALLQGGYVRRQPKNPAPNSTPVTRPYQLVKSGTRACVVSLVLLSLLPLFPGRITSRFSTASILLHTAAAGFAFVSATVVNSLNALASFETEDELHQRKGAALGAFRSKGQLGRAVGPLFATVIYWVWGPAVAYRFGALGLLWVAWGVTKVGENGTKSKQKAL